MEWVLVQGRFDEARWRAGWAELFRTHRLAHNRRSIRKVVVSDQGDGAFAVVDVDTLWVRPDGAANHWKGRTCKVYSKVRGEWKMTMQTGVLSYPGMER
jgi:ketosteroid isomerase-like protein